MHILARFPRRPKAWRNALAVVLLLEVPLALAVACSSTPTNPPELSAQDTGIPDHFEAAQPEPEEKPEPMPEPVPETGPDVFEAEAGCMPLNDAGVVAVVSPAALLFGTAGDGGTNEAGNTGLVACGQQAAPQTVTLTNETCAPFNFMTNFTNGGSSYSVNPSQGTVAALGSATLTINPVNIPQDPSTPSNYDGTLNITTNAPNDFEHSVTLGMAVYGAVLTAQSPAINNVPVGTSAPGYFTVSNGGNAPATVTVTSASPFFVIGSAVDGGATTFTVPANGGSIQTNVVFSPTQPISYMDTLQVSVAPTWPLCQSSPPTIQLNGGGEPGTVQLSTLTLDFGPVQCGAPAAPPQTITLSNSGGAATFSGSFGLGANAHYSLQDGSGNPVAQGAPLPLPSGVGTAKITVVPNAITSPATTAANGFGDTLTITTTVPGDGAHSVALQETAQGAIFALNPTSVSTNANPDVSTFVGFTVLNNGNYTASYTLAVVTTKGPTDTFSSNLTGGSLAGQTTQGGILTCIGDPSDAGNVQDLGTLTLTPAAGSVLCADPPPAMELSITN